VKGLKQYNEDFRVLLDDLKDYLDDLKTTKLFDRTLFKLEKNTDTTLAIKKIPSQVLTFQLFEAGKSIPEIAKERGVVVETIFGHLAKFASQGLVDLTRVVPKENIKIFEKTFFETENKEATLTDWKNKLPAGFQYNEIRLLLNHYLFLSSKESH